MSPFRFPFALLGLLAFVLVIPGWMYFVYEYASGLDPASHFIATMMLPAMAALFLSSWIQPGGA